MSGQMQKMRDRKLEVDRRLSSPPLHTHKRRNTLPITHLPVNMR
jgi:hypothetical protein